MGVNRRDFLKITGLGTLAGVGGKAAADLVFKGQAEAQEAKPREEALVGKRWAMVVDTKKCIEKIKKDGCKDCSIACHAVHNVPDFGNPKDEIKWIWQDTFEHICPNQHHPFTSENLEGAPFLALCNHCDNPPCVRVCPTQAIRDLTLEEKKHAKIGTAVILKEKCLVWEQDRVCLICDEQCPYNAIVFKTVEGFRRPFVLENKCNGCGFCEHKCPIEGESAIVVRPLGEVRLKEGSYLEEAEKSDLALKEESGYDQFLFETEE